MDMDELDRYLHLDGGRHYRTRSALKGSNMPNAEEDEQEEGDKDLMDEYYAAVETQKDE